MDLSRKRDRERLKVRHDPYWQRLGKGAALGFRRGAETWLARFRGRDGRQQFQALGEALEYDEAKRRAEEWMGQLGRAAVRSVKRATVREALEAYLTDLRRHGRADAARDAEWRFKSTVSEDAIADAPLESVTRDDGHRLPEDVQAALRRLLAQMVVVDLRQKPNGFIG